MPPSRPPTRPWTVVAAAAPLIVSDFDKLAVMRLSGLPARDLRILDPLLSYPSTILGRERAIVVKLEHIKAIVTATEVLVANPGDPLVSKFVRELQRRVSDGGHGSRSGRSEAQERSSIDVEDLDSTPVHLPSIDNGSEQPSRHFENSTALSLKDRSAWPTLEMPEGWCSKVLPFEFRVLEVCLECSCQCLESEALTLEQEAHPALDELASKISTLNLDRARQIKSRLVAITGRVQKVRDELEHLLDDDMDMAEMYLTDKLNQQQLEEVVSTSDNDIDDDTSELDYKRDERSTNKTGGSSKSFKLTPDINELEMLLEAYFVRIEGTLNKLSTLREYVDDTEDYINIMLDDKRNQLLQMAVILSTATTVLNAGIAVVATFGMNIHIWLYDAEPRKFWETTISCIVTCVLLFITAIAWGKRRGLLS